MTSIYHFTTWTNSYSHSNETSFASCHLFIGFYKKKIGKLFVSAFQIDILMTDVKVLIKDKLNSDSFRPCSPNSHPRLCLASLPKTEILFYTVAVKLLGAESPKRKENQRGVTEQYANSFWP